MNKVKSIRLNRATGQVACFNGNSEILKIDTISLKVSLDSGFLNFIKHVGSVNSAITQFQKQTSRSKYLK